MIEIDPNKNRQQTHSIVVIKINEWRERGDPAARDEVAVRLRSRAVKMIHDEEYFPAVVLASLDYLFDQHSQSLGVAYFEEVVASQNLAWARFR